MAFEEETEKTAKLTPNYIDYVEECYALEEALVRERGKRKALAKELKLAREGVDTLDAQLITAAEECDELDGKLTEALSQSEELEGKLAVALAEKATLEARVSQLESDVSILSGRLKDADSGEDASAALDNLLSSQRPPHLKTGLGYGQGECSTSGSDKGKGPMFIPASEPTVDPEVEIIKVTPSLPKKATQ